MCYEALKLASNETAPYDVQAKIDALTYATVRVYLEMNQLMEENATLLSRLEEAESRQHMHHRQTNDRLEELLRAFGEKSVHECSEQAQQTIFFGGQVYDAFSLLADIVQRAQRHIVLIDGFTNLGTLNILSKKREGVEAILYTTEHGSDLTRADVRKFNAQYPKLTVRRTNDFHDRFLILDDCTAFHIGASLKDAGKKCFAISRLEDERIVSMILEHLPE